MRIPIIHFNDTCDGGPGPASRFTPSVPPLDLEGARAAQAAWAARSVGQRLAVVGNVRAALAMNAQTILRDLGGSAHEDAEVLSSQILPLVEACAFLQRQAASILKPAAPKGPTPLWLRGTRAEIHREPYGVILVIAPSNYPLLLPGVMVLQALAAGNAVLLKPAPAGLSAANELRRLLAEAGLPSGLFTVLPAEEISVTRALAGGVNKVLFTGGARTGRLLLNQFADHLVPSVMELSGSDAMFVRHDADVRLAARALLFGLRLNQGATCIAPRRVFVHHSRAAELESCIVEMATDHGSRQHCTTDCASRVAQLVTAATASGARVLAGEIDSTTGSINAPVIVTNARPSMRLLREDHFGPAAAIVTVQDDEEALLRNEECPYALGATIFSANEREALGLAARINAGVVVINDMIVPTADPRIPFGGRKESGFGVTRGAEGLLELTVPKVVMRRAGNWRPHLEKAAPEDREIFTQFLKASHSGSWAARIKAAGRLARAIWKRRQHEQTH